jgi:cell filamentation protein
LNAFESELVFISTANLPSNPVISSFDLKHLQSIHKHLFKAVYPFAGEIRKTEIAKSGKLFMPYKEVEKEAQECFEQLSSENHLQDLEITAFATRAGHYFNRINIMHPFREGNGRSQRALFDALAIQAGYAFNWAGISQDAMGKACQNGRVNEDDGESLSRLLLLCIAPLIK